MKLNLGCGRHPIDGWVNVDKVEAPGVIFANLEDLHVVGSVSWADNSVDEFLMSHVIEHVHNTLPLMQELHRIAKPGAKLTIRCPYGSSDDADEDPTHVRRYFLQSFGYFSQPYYWRADYGYRGDWVTTEIHLSVTKQTTSDAQLMHDVYRQRNMVGEMAATLFAVKPIRDPRKELQTQPQIIFDRVL